MDLKHQNRQENPTTKGEIVVAITGSRDWNAERSGRDVARKMHELVSDPRVREIVFGGAVGIDTATLQCAHHVRRKLRAHDRVPRFVVIVPDIVDMQPDEAARVIRAYADEIIELKNRITETDSYNSYRIRNRAMIDRADKLVAFPTGRSAGTQMTIKMAKEKRIPIEYVHIHAGKK